MPAIKQKYRQALVADLTPHPENPRQADVGAIHTSIERNGFYGAIIVQLSTGYVLAGNHRLLALRQQGAAKVPIIEVDVDDETATRIMLADNRTNDLASYDNDLLSSLLQTIAQESPEALLGTGYDGDDLDDLLASLQEDNGLPNADGNVGREGTDSDRLDKYRESAIRSILLDYPLEEFRWVVDQLGAIRDKLGAESTAATVRMLVEKETGEAYGA
jgi:hypothetical protein